MEDATDTLDELAVLARDVAARADVGDGARVRSVVESRLFESVGPARLGRFELIRVLGLGGMGVVYLARDPDLGRPVAIKVLRPEFEQRAFESARREASGLARLSHPNVVTVYEIGSDGTQLFIVMEYVEGRTIDAWCADVGRDRRGIRAISGVFVQAGRGLAAIHQAGLVHRDFKPGNVLVGQDGRARVTDFGLAKVLDAQEGATLSEAVPPEASSIRATAMAGTLAYMSPEQLRGDAVDARTDVFSFCASLYEVLTGSAAYPDTSRQQREEAFVDGGPTKDAASGIRQTPARLKRILLTGLAVRREDRWPSMDAVVTELEPLARSPRRGAILVAVTAAAGLSLALAVGTSGDPCAGSVKAIQSVWNADAQARLRSSFVGVDRPYADTALRNAVVGLDAYVQAWEQTSRENCEATLVDSTQSAELMDRRSQCLRRRLAALDGTIALLSDADPGVVRKTAAVIDSLPPVEPCADVDALVDDPPLSAPALRAQEQLDEAHALWVGGRYEAAAERLDRLAPNILANAPALSGRAALQRSRLDFNAGRHEEAAARLDEALTAAATAGDDHLIAEVHTASLFQTRSRGHSAELLNEQIRVARAAVVRAGEPPRLAVVLEGSYAAALISRGKPREAAKAQLVALEIAAAHGLGLRREGLASLGLAQAYQQAGDHEGAQDALARARAALSSALGPEHPFIPAIDNTEGDIALARGDYERARTAYARAIQALQADFGQDHPRTRATLSRLAGALEAAGRWDEALALQRELVDYERRERGSDDPAYAVALSGLGITLQESDRLAEAVGAFREVLEIERNAKGPTHIDVAEAHHNLATALGRTESFAEAGEHQRIALAQFVELLGPDHLVVASARNSMAAVYLAEGRLDRAADELQRAAHIYDKHPEVRGLDNIALALVTGDLHLARFEPRSAIEAYGRAQALATEVLGPGSQRAIEAIVWSGVAQLQARALDVARDRFREALDLLVHKPGAELEIRARLGLAEAIAKTKHAEAEQLRSEARRMCEGTPDVSPLCSRCGARLTDPRNQCSRR